MALTVAVLVCVIVVSKLRASGSDDASRASTSAESVQSSDRVEAVPSALYAAEQSDGAAHPMELPAIVPGHLIIKYSSAENPERLEYTVDYDVENKIPRWVAYDLTVTELDGTNTREGKNFRPDPEVNAPQADNYDYRNSGYDKGHMAPAADFKWSEKAMDDTFYYTNCCPQKPYFNRHAWEKLESRVRSWAGKFGCLYVVTGSIVGDCVNGKLGANQITIPDAFYKALLTKDGDTYHSVAFVMHNLDTPQPYVECSMTINALEEITGVDFFCALDDSIEEQVEGTVDRRFWKF